jgi:hypothetical protein
MDTRTGCVGSTGASTSRLSTRVVTSGENTEEGIRPLVRTLWGMKTFLVLCRDGDFLRIRGCVGRDRGLEGVKGGEHGGQDTPGLCQGLLGYLPQDGGPVPRGRVQLHGLYGDRVQGELVPVTDLMDGKMKS